MSQETMEWLNSMTLIGFTEKRGDAWHYQESLQGDEPNHYVGPVPVPDIERRLFAWEPIEATCGAFWTDDKGNKRQMRDGTRKAIVRPAGALSADDEGAVIGVASRKYVVHEFKKTLLRQLENVIDDNLAVGSAGLLRGGAWAWVQVETPETVEIEGTGIKFRPFITATTSLDGSLKSCYQAGSTLVVCDNTLAASLAEAAALRIGIKHTSKSLPRVNDIKNALGIIHKVDELFTAEVTGLLETEVSDKAWTAFLDLHELTSLTAEGESKEGRSLTIAQNKRDKVTQLYKTDARVAPWTGTAFGVLQAVNTFAHHDASVRGASRVQRNAMRKVTGEFQDLDSHTIEVLGQALAAVA